MLHRTARFERCDELGVEALELVLLLIEEDDALRGEPVFQSIAAGDGASGLGTRAGAIELIAPIGFDYGMARPSPHEWIR